MFPVRRKPLVIITAERKPIGLTRHRTFIQQGAAHVRLRTRSQLVQSLFPKKSMREKNKCEMTRNDTTSCQQKYFHTALLAG